MKIDTVNCIKVSDLRKLSDEANEAIDAFFHADFGFVVGNANRVLLDIGTFVGFIELALEQRGLWTDEEHHLGYTDISETLHPFRNDVLIDLRN